MLKMSKKINHEKHESEGGYSDPFTSALQIGTGASIMRGNTAMVPGMVMGRDNLWHSTPKENFMASSRGKGIGVEGLSVEHAGKNKRLNSLMLSNGIIRDTESYLKKKNIKITPKIEQDLFEVTEDFLKQYKGGDGAGTAMHKRTKEVAYKVSKLVGVNADDLKKHYDDNLPSFGKRIYLGKSPSAISFWGGKGNELDFAVGQTAKRTQSGTGILLDSLYGIADQMSGGTISNIRDKFHYGSPNSKATSNSVADAIRDHVSKPGSHTNVIFRTSVPTAKLDNMTDLPGVRHLLSSSPMVKHLFSKFLPQNDPSKDLSLPHGTDPKNVNMIDLVDKSGRVQKRIKIENAKKTPMSFLGGKGNRLSTVKKLMIPGMLTAIGGSMVYDGLDDIYGNFKTKKRKKGSKFSKTSAINYKSLAKVGLTGAAIGGALYSTPTIARKLTGNKLPDTYTKKDLQNGSMRKKLKIQKDVIAAQNKIILETSALNAMAGGALGALLAPKGSKLIGGALGSAVGTYAGNMATASSEASLNMMRTDPTSSGLLGATAGRSRKVRDFMRENPEVVNAGDASLMMGLLAATPYYAAKKYYPYHAGMVSKGIGNLKLSVSAMADDIRRNPVLRNRILLGSAAVTLGLPAMTYGMGKAVEGMVGLGVKDSDKKKKKG